MEDRKLLALITINWKRYDLTKNLLVSIQKSTVRPDVYLVDNEFDEQKSIELGPFCKEIYKFKENTGYSFANNYAAKKTDLTYEYLLFTNNDIIVDSGAVETLLKYAKKLPPHSVLHPISLKYNNPAEISSAGSLNILGPGVGYRYENKKLAKVKGALKPVMDQNYLYGSCFLIKSDDFLDVGGFDERFYIYHEDNDLSRRLRRKFNSKFFCITEAVVYHVQHGSEPFHQKRHLYYTYRNIALYLTDNRKIKEAFIKFGCKLVNICLYLFRKNENVEAVYTGFNDYIRGIFGRSKIYK
ncbi:hypothetical protein A3F07_03575 [candidate division WWE3 bacterium RIFCSPHIGHO2_12_FULL_38_15]|uniref:Glycosyltransferase 2-like domain-containing protein n=1 Tax=candidate division WWE3 bacterium RIFCSPHIGHO2_02_FULL_38_14 TaxID=1802620 RepID=A0A1F4V751_UNCKA|nr:MAG: hypothetical protein A2793_02805 [candidate division WWE3 bacterium RIFCSPHIGHO2_01_FULL_38_45]OGC48878.1 MAG: hypothetical protein A3F07_03575 [candidate division WWE3 bacterium RIFCSPHIGHO2_12_FULL_38_15]OGC53025.1 MAG: hypothetical protein A3D91_01805 [candidate division WWE3 bacterium RIFCSPHIGHO2_02_FULL_38_14]OGC53181.1 MAG: hypothetical protein A3B64_01915 [candidate division WWE3 bacterium RIFCSPLOWO2_01_FULL_37_24]HLB52026.1 glycosyltransferase family 2 protein [Patescibacteria